VGIGGIERAVGIGAVDQVINPYETREKVAQAIAAATRPAREHPAVARLRPVASQLDQVMTLATAG
jgi:hypothetical protein